MPKKMISLEIVNANLEYMENNDEVITTLDEFALKTIKQDLEELERWRKGEFIIVPARHSGKTPYWVLATKELDKYMTAFDILKDKEIIKLTKNDFNQKYYLQRNDTNGNVITIELTQEEYELIEEVLEDASKN